MAHYKMKCKQCGTVISQCRCMSKDKVIEYVDACSKCMKNNLEKRPLSEPQGNSMTGNETTWAHDVGLRAIARARWQDPLNTWPQHEKRHERTIMGARLPDDQCLRCQLEIVAAAEAQAVEEAQAKTKGC